MTTQEKIEIAAHIAAGILMLDALGFMFWLASGQTPSDGFYIGTITAHVLRLIF